MVRASIFTRGMLAGGMLLVSLGCKVREPGKLETSLAQTVKQRITIGGKDDQNPLPATAENIHAGRDNFSHYCFACHGLDGQNTGVPFAEKMSPPVPLLTSPAVQGYTDGQLKWVIDNGIFPSGMPASKGILNDDEIWQIVVYVRNLPAKGSLGEPAVYSGQENLPAAAIKVGK
jgi:mono/diheme cytochrome c family protein